MKVAFGRVNIPHPGHRHIISLSDVFILSSGSSKNKLDENIRYESLVELYPEIKSKIVIAKISDYIKNLGMGVEILSTPENYTYAMVLAEFVNGSVEVVEKINNFSSTLIRQYVRGNMFDELYKIYLDNKKTQYVIDLVNYESKK